MNAEWLSDFRKIPDEVMNYLRRMAVRAVEDQHHSPELCFYYSFCVDQSLDYNALSGGISFKNNGDEYPLTVM